MTETLPVVLCVSASGLATARAAAAVLGGALHGRAGRVTGGDIAVVFAETTAHVRDLFAAGVPVVGVCAAGILIRAVAPHLADKRREPPLICLPEDGSAVIPLLGGHRGANDLARRLAAALGCPATISTAGDSAFGIALDAPPPGWVLATPGAAQPAMAALLAGAGARREGAESRGATWLAGLPDGDGVRVLASLAPLPVLLAAGDDREPRPQGDGRARAAGERAGDGAEARVAGDGGSGPARLGGLDVARELGGGEGREPRPQGVLRAQAAGAAAGGGAEARVAGDRLAVSPPGSDAGTGEVPGSAEAHPGMVAGRAPGGGGVPWAAGAGPDFASAKTMAGGDAGPVQGNDAPQDDVGCGTSGGEMGPGPATPPTPGPVLLYHPLRAALGVGAARDCPEGELAGLVEAVLAEAGVAAGALCGVFTLDLKADEPAVLALSRALDRPLRLFFATELEALTPRLATPSEVVFAEVGCHGVAEAAALAGGGAGAVLAVTKRKTAHATAALALAPAPVTVLPGRSRGRLAILGIGPGQADWRTPEVSKLVTEADLLVGYGLYLDLLGPLARGKERAEFPLGGEEARCRFALEAAGQGRSVALVSSGDAGIYAMGALVYELLDRPPERGGVGAAARRAEVISAPGISALQAAAARAGAPLGHDFCAISLSDLLTPRADILRRIGAAAAGDFVIAFYNPVSQRRRTLLAEARDMLLQHRPADTPVLLATSLGRPEESLRFRRLDALEVDEVDMLTVVLVGSSQSRLVRLGEGPRMYTPRGYARHLDAAGAGDGTAGQGEPPPGTPD